MENKDFAMRLGVFKRLEVATLCGGGTRMYSIQPDKTVDLSYVNGNYAVAEVKELIFELLELHRAMKMEVDCDAKEHETKTAQQGGNPD